MSQQQFTRIAAFTAATAAIVLAGCAAQPIGLGAVARPGTVAALNPRLKAAVTLREVTGPATPETSTWSMFRGGPGNADAFRRALLDSLAMNGYYTSNPAAARLAVSANIEELTQPAGGVSMQVRTNVTYTVTGPGGARSFPIEASGTAYPSDSLDAAERLRIANERAFAENIRKFLAQLSALS
ncbi:MAG TPA: hypothetical protein VHA82_15865 [Ramlibacter sp.]|uniref:hypothetical protein n=1 Tax=Ramlibacter sp. TaxID=1917967 RepID=UPI002CE2E8E6|nr:hypothetical protein [Ramlibacter sp.]HVZ45287.1 hypothetical protein [Ramlibacter sp.]